MTPCGNKSSLHENSKPLSHYENNKTKQPTLFTALGMSPSFGTDVRSRECCFPIQPHHSTTAQWARLAWQVRTVECLAQY